MDRRDAWASRGYPGSPLAARPLDGSSDIARLMAEEPSMARPVRKESWMRYMVPALLLGTLMFTAVFIGRYGSLDPCNMVRQEMLIQGRMHGGRTGEIQARSLAQETFDPYVQSGAIDRTQCAQELLTIWTSGLNLPRQFAEGS